MTSCARFGLAGEVAATSLASGEAKFIFTMHQYNNILQLTVENFTVAFFANEQSPL